MLLLAPHLSLLAAPVVLLLAFALVWLAGPWVVGFCRRQGLVAAITTRHAHSVPTPHGGGVMIVAVGVVLGLLVLQVMSLPNEDYLRGLLVASLGIAGVGWLDDKHALDARTRLLVHLGAVTVGLALLPQLADFMPLWLEKLVLMLGWGWFISLFNFMDGADGQSSSEAVVVALGVALLEPALAPLAAIIAGAALGFLRINWRPARIFMGDVGSTWLGYVLGGLILLALVDNTWRLFFPMAVLTMLFCADATWTLVRRVLQGHNPGEPHKTFWFHRALAAFGWRHDQLVRRETALNAVLLVLALGGFWLTQFSLWWGPVTLLVAVILMLVVGRAIVRRERERR